MTKRCTPQIVKEAHLQACSWRKAARRLNSQYGVEISHVAWRDYALEKHDIADPEKRARLGLPPRPCPTCGRRHTPRKSSTPRRIREYGYPSERAKTFFEVIELHHALR
jgi:hypothetical protein